ncbi:MAG TPA: copper resistance protein CopC [Chloroflexota bacterium]|nr:copper resistance protein CopC [Chloroflexota bacterium]
MADRNPGLRPSRAARWLAAFLAAALLGLACAPRPALAHAVLVDSSILPGSLLSALPATLTLRFSENMATSASNLTVTGPSGASAVSGVPAVTGGGRTLSIRLAAQGGGTYRVYWNSISAEDGRAMAGAFSFAVAYTTAAGDLTQALSAHGSHTLAVSGFLAALVHWLLLLAVLSWAGIALLEMPAGVFASRGAEAWVTTFAPQVRGVRTLLLEVILGLLIFEWILEAAQISSAGRAGLFGSVFALARGHLGFYRLVLLVLPLWALLSQRAEAPPPPRPPVAKGATPATARIGAPADAKAPASSPPARLAGALPTIPALPIPRLNRWGQVLIAAIFLLALSASGHAGGVPDLTLSAVLLDWLHALASVAWIGGMAYFVLAALPVLENTDLDKRAPLTLGLLRRYAAFAGAGILVLIITGIFAAQTQIGSTGRLLGSSYGHRLDFKIVLVFALLVLTAYLLVVQRDQAERTWTGRHRLENLGILDRMGTSLRVGLAVGALILLTTAALWSNAPASAIPLPIGASRLAAMPSGSWTSAGLRGLVVNRVLFASHDRHTLWAATDKGVWLSTDDQQTWHQRGSTLAKLSILDLMAIDNGGTLLATGANGQIYRTSDVGKHWRLMGRPFGKRPLRSLAMQGKVLLAAGDDGIFRSTDDSKHWTRTLNDHIATVYWSPAARQFLAGVENGPWLIYGGGNGGRIWQALPTAPTVKTGVLALAATDGANPRFLAAAGTAGLWVAPTAGGIWATTSGFSAGATVGALLPDHRTLGWVYAGTEDAGPYASVDGGATWRPLGSGAPMAIHNLVMRPGPVRVLYAATDDGVWTYHIG